MKQVWPKEANIAWWHSLVLTVPPRATDSPAGLLCDYSFDRDLAAVWASYISAKEHNQEE